MQNSTAPEAHSPLEEVDEKSLDEIYNSDPEELSKKDFEILIRETRRMSQAMAEKGKGKGTKKPSGRKAEKNELEDL